MTDPIPSSTHDDEPVETPSHPVKLVALLRRKKGLTEAEFVAHWRDRHGPLIRDTPSIAQHIVRYEQHTRFSDSVWSGTGGLDGVAIQWFEDFAAWEAFLAEPDYARLIAPDEARFLDSSTIQFIVCNEPTVVIGDE